MWLDDIWNWLKQLFSGTESKAGTPLPPAGKKKFDIRQTQSQKKFNIETEQRIPIKRKGKLNIVNKGRPRSCPRCLSNKTIIKARDSGFNWECSREKGGCTYTWK